MDDRDTLILCYHAVSRDWPASLALPPDRFERQIAFLLERGWHPTTFTSAVKDTSPGRYLAITFDDAFASVGQLARPILERLGAPATVFAPTAFMDGTGPLSWEGISQWHGTPHASELAALTWQDLAELAAAGWEVGSHTRTHARLTRLDDAGLAAELRGSRDECTRRLGRPCRSVAFPYGDDDPRVFDAAARAGYEAAARLVGALRLAGPYGVPRIGIYNEDHWPRFLAKVSRPVRRLRASRFWVRD